MNVKSFDLQEIVEDWAREYFMRKATRKERNLMNQDAVSLNLDWNKVVFIHDPTEYYPQPPQPGGGNLAKIVLFTTSFTNKTSTKQKYAFKVERCTKSICSFEIEKGFTKGYDLNVKITTPGQMMEASAGFKKEMTLNKLEEQSMEQELSWGTDSEIEVDPRSTAETQLVVIEEKYDGRFEVKTHVKGRIRVTFNNLRNNNSYIKTVEADLADVLKMCSGKISKLDCEMDFKQDRSVTIITNGKCFFRYGIKQEAEVDQIPYKI